MLAIKGHWVLIWTISICKLNAEKLLLIFERSCWNDHISVQKLSAHITSGFFMMIYGIEHT